MKEGFNPQERLNAGVIPDGCAWLARVRIKGIRVDPSDIAADRSAAARDRTLQRYTPAGNKYI